MRVKIGFYAKLCMQNKILASKMQQLKQQKTSAFAPLILKRWIRPEDLWRIDLTFLLAWGHFFNEIGSWKDAVCKSGEVVLHHLLAFSFDHIFLLKETKEFSASTESFLKLSDFEYSDFLAIPLSLNHVIGVRKLS